MKLKNIALSALLLFTTATFVACDDWLDKEPSKNTQKTIETADQLDALLATYTRFLKENNHTALACDDYGLPEGIHQNKNGGMELTALQHILWSDEVTASSRLLWQDEYTKIYYANLVLASIGDVSGTAEQKANLKAEAHFLRAYCMFQLAVAYTLYYDGTNGEEPGLPLKKTVSFEESSSRASLAATWAFIESDIQEALNSNMPLTSNGKRRPWRGTTAAIHGFAARYYLYRGDFANALNQVEAVLRECNTLKDFNTSMSYSQNDETFTINETTGNKEVVTIYFPNMPRLLYMPKYNIISGYPELFEWEEMLYARICAYASWWYIPSKELLDTFAIDAPDNDPKNDLRYEYFIVEDCSLRQCKKDPAYRYPAYCHFHYDDLISGLTVAEMLLIKAEVQARQGNWQDAMNTLDPLRRARIKASAYTKLEATSQADAIRKILQERRREMPFTIRWYDLKRLNANDDPTDDVTITRKFYPFNSSAVMDQDPEITYTLAPKSRHYAIPIPNVEIQAGKGAIKQNTY